MQSLDLNLCSVDEADTLPAFTRVTTDEVLPASQPSGYLQGPSPTFRSSRTLRTSEVVEFRASPCVFQKHIATLRSILRCWSAPDNEGTGNTATKFPLSREIIRLRGEFVKAARALVVKRAWCPARRERSQSGSPPRYSMRRHPRDSDTETSQPTLCLPVHRRNRHQEKGIREALWWRIQSHYFFAVRAVTESTQKLPKNSILLLFPAASPPDSQKVPAGESPISLPQLKRQLFSPTALVLLPASLFPVLSVDFISTLGC